MLTGYVKFTDEQKERANQIDLVDYLEKRDVALIRAGRDMRIKEDKSVTVRGNRWYDHSAEKGGYPIDFMREYYGLNFQDAMEELIGNSVCFELPYKTYTPKYEPLKEFKLPNSNDNSKRLYAYLTSTRGINPTVASFFIMNNYIY